MTLVRDLMSASPQRCVPSHSLNDVARLMWEHDCGCVPVVDEFERVVGILTDRDVCVGAYTQGKALAEIPVSSVCSTEVRTCKADDPIDRAQALMMHHQVRRLPVVSDDGCLIGVLSLSDIAQHAHFVATACGARASTYVLASVIEAVSRARGLASIRNARRSTASEQLAQKAGQ